MALQQCLSGGRKMLMAKLPGNSNHIRHLFWSSSLDARTQKWNLVNGNMPAFDSDKSLCSGGTKWPSIKTKRHDYSQLHSGQSGKESSENKDDEKSDANDDDEDDDCDKGDDDEEENFVEKEKISSQLNNIFTNKKEMSSAEWEEVIVLMKRENSLVTPQSCDAITMKKCLRHNNYLLGTSYLHHMKQEGREPNLSTLGSYLQLCGEHVNQCGEERVLQHYHKLMSQTKVLDIKLLTNAIVGVAATQEWRLALDLLPRFKKMASKCSKVYSAIITAAFRAGDHDLAWHLFDIMKQEGEDPEDNVILEWVKQCDAMKDEAKKEAMLFTLLDKLEAFETFPSVTVIREVARLCREELGWSAHYLKMPRSGRCPACKHQMEIKEVSQEEFRQLQQEFVPRVLMGSDIFRSTHPEEWQDFQRFVEKRRPFTVVVDGLNASYFLGKKADRSRQQSLKDVVEQAVAHHPDSRVLVLGRHHMSKWVSKMRWDMERVCIYTLNNMSKDDGFFLYAALQSGLGTKFITSDMLRDHLFRLGERYLQDTFRRWQRTHQVMAFSAGGRARLLFPPTFSTVTQKRQLEQQQQQQQSSSSPRSASPSAWHVPYNDGKPRQSYELPTTWLCLHPTLTRSSLPSPYVSLDPFTYTPPHESTPSPHGSDTAQRFLQRHQHRSVLPIMNTRGGGGGVGGGGGGKKERRPPPPPQGRLQHTTLVDDGLERPRVNSYVGKNRKKVVQRKKSSLDIEVNVSSIFGKDER